MQLGRVGRRPLPTAGMAVAASQLSEKRQTVKLTVENIHEQLDALDPVTRAAVIARLSSDEVKKVREHSL